MMIGNRHNKALMGSTDAKDAYHDTGMGRQATVNVAASGVDLIDGVLSGYAWRDGKVTYAFPDSKNDYNYSGEKNKQFDTVDGSVRSAARFILDQAFGGKANDGFSVEGFTKLKVSPGSDGNATLRYAESAASDPSAYAYYPSTSSRGGDVWFGTRAGYDNAVAGNYDFLTVIHETGHALGLKHGHESENGFASLPKKYDALEYSVMTYKSYVGDDAQYYKNEYWGYPQSYMMADIAALQHLYGADYNVNDGNTVYSWKPGSGRTFVNGNIAIDPGGNRIFATIWDGGGRHDTYDLSAYDGRVKIDLSPGGYSVFKTSQLADLNAYKKPNSELAHGNIYNTLLHEDDQRSLIEDAIGGSGNDRIKGNVGRNSLDGKGGDDLFLAGEGKDSLHGGGGHDVFVFRSGWGRDTIEDFAGADRINLKNFDLNSFADVMALAENDGKDVIITFGGGDSITLEGVHIDDLRANDFLL